MTDHLSVWWHYKQADQLPPEAVERMWRALDKIAAGAVVQHPGHVDYMTKATIAAIAASALPSDADAPKCVLQI